MLWFKLKPWLEQNQCFCVKTVFFTKSCFTQKPSYAQTPCFTQKQWSCWACARALYGLQDSFFHGGRPRRRRWKTVILSPNKTGLIIAPTGIKNTLLESAPKLLFSFWIPRIGPQWSANQLSTFRTTFLSSPWTPNFPSLAYHWKLYSLATTDSREEWQLDVQSMKMSTTFGWCSFYQRL